MLDLDGLVMNTQKYNLCSWYILEESRTRVWERMGGWALK